MEKINEVKEVVRNYINSLSLDDEEKKKFVVGLTAITFANAFYSASKELDKLINDTKTDLYVSKIHKTAYFISYYLFQNINEHSKGKLYELTRKSDILDLNARFEKKLVEYISQNKFKFLEHSDKISEILEGKGLSAYDALSGFLINMLEDYDEYIFVFARLVLRAYLKTIASEIEDIEPLISYPFIFFVAKEVLAQ